MDPATSSPHAPLPTPEVAALAAEAWAMAPTRLDALFAALASVTPDRLAQARGARGSLFGVPADPPPPYEIVDGVASIAVRGVVLQSVPEWFAWFGIEAASTDSIRSALAGAMADPDVSAVLLVVDSPGGTIGGLQELGDEIYAARGTKPIEAACQNLCASAAYWIASQADAVSATKTTEVGSIGVYSVARDFSRMYELAGIKTHVIASSKLKGAGSTGAPITDGQLAVWQEQIDALSSLFCDAVARGRGMDASAVAAVAKGREWIASEALRLGLVDTVASVEETHRALASRSGRGGRVGGMSAGAANRFLSRAKAERKPMSIIENPAVAASANRIAELEAQLAAKTAEADAAAKASAERVEAEAKIAVELAERVAKLEEERLHETYLAKAKALPNVVGLATSDLATAMRCLEGGKPVPQAVAAKLIASFSQINAVVSKSALFAEVGTASRDGGAASDRIDAYAAELRAKDPSLTKAASKVLACAQHPELYREAQTL